LVCATVTSTEASAPASPSPSVAPTETLVGPTVGNMQSKLPESSSLTALDRTPLPHDTETDETVSTPGSSIVYAYVDDCPSKRSVAPDAMETEGATFVTPIDRFERVP
jgi:hypothetical protein